MTITTDEAMNRSLSIYIILLCGSLLVGPLSSCSSDNNEQEPTKEDLMPVAFNATIGNELSTRAEDPPVEVAFGNDIQNNKQLNDKGGFGVFGCYTGLHKYVDSSVNPDFMYNEHVKSTDNGVNWTYSPIKYWPNGEGEVTGNTGANVHYVSFMAYAPYSDTDPNNEHSTPADYCIAGFSHQSEQGNPWLTYRLHSEVEDQVDLLYASHTTEGDNIHPLLDLTKPAVGDKVHFHFDHALACVGDHATFTCSENMRETLKKREGYTKVEVLVTACKIDYTLTEKGRLVLWNHGEANWQPIVSENPTCTRSVTLVEKTADDHNAKVVYSYEKSPNTAERVPNWEDQGHGVFYIPLELYKDVQSARITLTYTVRYYTNDEHTIFTPETPVTGTAGFNLSDPTYAAAYNPGKHLYLNIAIDMVSLQITGAIADWEVKATVTKEGNEVDD